MKELLKTVENCTVCKTINEHRKFSMQSHGNLNAFAMLVSEAPGKDSLAKNKYWVGAGGKIIRDCLPYETELEDIFYLTDIVKCWPNQNGENRSPLESEIKNCSEYLSQEIKKLKPKVILSFGGISSTFLLNRAVKITKEHGKVHKYNEYTNIITLLHPSGIDRFMDRRTYKTQLASLFMKIKENDLINMRDIFNEYHENEKDKLVEKEEQVLFHNIVKSEKGTFTIPSPGNSITEGDVSKNQIRITVDFKKYFPARSTELLLEFQQEHFNVKFNYRPNKSHILKLGNKLATRMRLEAGMKINMTVFDNNTYRINKII